jgi:hypothetical protein
MQVGTDADLDALDQALATFIALLDSLERQFPHR